MEAAQTMKTDRKWIVVPAVLTLLLLTLGCGGRKAPAPQPPPPPTMETPPPTDVPAKPAPTEGMDEQEKEPPMSIQEMNEKFRDQGLLGDVFFAFDKYDLRPDARERLAKNAEFMKSEEGRGLTFTVEGHCDERGTNEYNLALGQRRALAAVDYLVSLGVESARFKTVSYGEEKPFCTESTEACWQKNRRARFVISGNTAG
jgi:peptidoglycan-associated lipoprotein